MILFETILIVFDIFHDYKFEVRIKPILLTIGSILPKVGACSRSIGLIPVIHSR